VVSRETEGIAVDAAVFTFGIWPVPRCVGHASLDYMNSEPVAHAFARVGEAWAINEVR
jgi:hypothetical protein